MAGPDNNTVSIYEKLRNVQLELKAPKDRNNEFAHFIYRKAEDIIQAAKPLLQAQKLTLILEDDLYVSGDRYYVKAIATVTDDEGERISASAFAREELIKKGMDAAQITGSASSYARKYALSGLFAVDNTDTNDPDAADNSKPVEAPAPPKKPSDPTVATRSQLDRLKQIAQDLDLDENNTPDFFQDAIGKTRPTTRQDFEKSIAFGETVLADREDSTREMAAQAGQADEGDVS